MKWSNQSDRYYSTQIPSKSQETINRDQHWNKCRKLPQWKIIQCRLNAYVIAFVNVTINDSGNEISTAIIFRRMGMQATACIVIWDLAHWARTNSLCDRLTNRIQNLLQEVALKLDTTHKQVLKRLYIGGASPWWMYPDSWRSRANLPHLSFCSDPLGLEQRTLEIASVPQGMQRFIYLDWERACSARQDETKQQQQQVLNQSVRGGLI